MPPTAQNESKTIEWIKRTLAEDKVIAIVGWHDRNHDDFTRSLSEKQFNFFEGIPEPMPKRVGYVVTSRFLGHSEITKMRRAHQNCPFPFETGALKRLIKVALDIPTPNKSGEVPMGASTASATPATPPSTVVLQDFREVVSEAVLETHEPTQEEKLRAFAKEFIEACEASSTNSLTKHQCSPMLERCFGVDQRVASKHPDLLEPIIRDGAKRAGHYRPTQALLDLYTRPLSDSVEPKDPIERARWLVARAPKLRERIVKLTEEREQLNLKITTEIEAIEENLARSEKAEKLLSQMGGL